MKINIDGKELETKQGKTILEIARENNIYIPSLCDFKELEPFSGCRLCIVKVSGMKGYVPSCSTYAKEGMKVQTKTPDIIKLRRNILELILTEHPNACLICEEKDQCDEHKSTIRKVDEITGCVLCPNNGRCELQKVVEELGLEKINFPSVYRDFEITKDDPFFDRNYNLCILCGRCVRVCREVRGLSVISFIRRGAETIVATNLGKSLLDSGCQFCGACVDVCPTGALTEKAVKYDSPPDRKEESVCPLCSIGCGIEFNFFNHKLLGVDVVGSCPVNQGQACVRGRFTLRDVLQSENRIRKPLIRKNSHLEETTWDEALEYASKMLKKYKPNQVAVLTSPQMSCEDIFVINKFAKKLLKTDPINRKGFGSPLSLVSDAFREHGISSPLNYKLDDISDLDGILLVGGNIMETNPVIWIRILKAVNKGADFISVGALKQSMDRYASKKLRIKPGSESFFLACLSKELIEKSGEKKFSSLEGFKDFKNTLDSLSLDGVEQKVGISCDEIKQLADIIRDKGNLGFVFPPQCAPKEMARAHTRALLNLALLTKAQIFPLSAEGNERGWNSINKHFSENEKSSQEMWDGLKKGKIKALFTTAPVDLPADLDLEFFMVQDSHKGHHTAKADLVLPAAVLSETHGSIVNTEGRIQELKSPLNAPSKVKPDWKIVAEIAQKMGSKDFNFRTAQEIRKEIAKEISDFRDIIRIDSTKRKEIFLKEGSEQNKKLIPFKPVDGLEKTTQKFPLRLKLEYSLDYLRNCVLSEEIIEFEMFRNTEWIKINKNDADKYDLNEGDSVVLESKKGRFQGIIHFSEAIPPGMVSATYMPHRNEDRVALNLMPVKIIRGK